MARRIDGLTEDEFDTFVLVLGLVKEGWSFRKIGRIINRTDKNTKSLYLKGLELKESGNLRKTASSERDIRIQYVGGTQELEEIEQAVIERQHGQLRPKGHLAD